MFKKLFIIIGLLSSLYSSDLDWNSNYKKALQEAKLQNKDIYFLITSSDCRWCRKFETKTLGDTEVIEKLKEKYVLLAMNKDFDDIPSKFKAKSVPKHYFITSKDEIIHSFLGAWMKEDFYSFLSDVDKRKAKKLKEEGK